ncbi:glutaredoxin family protein [Cellulomonas triticagri]|uniref:Glutaredoxin family protein n=1 Tax=Cellulomonas triticagri TaxID=2483352 RepID=A0A3M2JJ70_9CELL|nr:glutaredoxin family protein [Cellulomonas triticagri]RMI13134.1 glutaredoxin family protein [Cellulomonas triticagri]
MPTTTPPPPPSTGPGDADARVTLYVRAGCHLCDQAREVVARVAAEQGAGWREVDVDAGGTAPDGRSLAAAYGELLPVVEVDGERVGFWEIHPFVLAGALRGAPSA